MLKENFSREWNFKFQGKTSQVDLPHDFSITQKRNPGSLSGTGGGFFPGGIADYEKTLFIPDDWKGKRVFLEFEGVYMNATVRMNKNIVTKQPYGYSAFHCELTPYIKYGKDNLISVNVNNNALPNSRWYSGSGIYRHVWLMAAEDTFIPPYGVSVTAQNESSVKVETKIDGAGLVCLRSSVYDASGNKAACDETARTFPGNGADNIITQNITIPDAELWSLDNPYLYTLKTEVLKDGKVLDSATTAFGVRTVSVDRVNGFRLNGVTIKMKGGCVHHDCGLLGSAAFDRAEERKIELLKASGFNAVRCAHNPPSPAFLDACDRLGMLVIDEAFDAWREPKLPYDYSLYFDDWWKRDMEAMILRDRNHPSVVIWSTGNEIPELDSRSDGIATAKKLADYIRKLDNSRPVTNALCGMWWGNEMAADEVKDKDFWGILTKEFAAPLDITGYNYFIHRYEKDGALFPERIIAGTETFPKEAFEYWEMTEKLPYVIGDFVWTAIDYLGEAGLGRVYYKDEPRDVYPIHHAFCGDIDICGFKRPQSYYRDFVWGIGKEPYIAVYKPEYYGKEFELSPWAWVDVVNSWSWHGFEDKPIQIEIYSGGDEVELFLNGESLGRKPAGKANKYIAKYETVYKSGELIAVTYENGVEKYRSCLKTAGEPAAIRLTADRKNLQPKNGDLSFVTVELLDANGNIAHHADNEIHFTVSGAGVLQAVGSGNHKSEEMYAGECRRIHEGKAMAVVKSNGEKGSIILSASSDGISSAQIELTVE